jgi:hypothetical protein
MSGVPIGCNQGDLDVLMTQHKIQLANLGVYESISKTMAVNGKGLVALSPLLTALVQLAPWANLLQTQIREAIETVNADGMLNSTKMSHQAWARQRTEKVILLFSHLRRLRKEFRFNQCTAKMSRQDKSLLSNIISLIDGKYGVELDGASSSSKSKRRLQAHHSNASALTLDSDGYPAMLISPQKVNHKSPSASVEVPQQIFEEEKSEDQFEMPCLKRPSRSTVSSMKKMVHKKPAMVHKKPACGVLLCPDFPRRLETTKGILKLTFATGQSYIHFQDLASRETTFLLSRTAKSSPDHHDHILNLAQKLAKLKHGTAGQMKEAALKMKTW